MSDEDIIKRQRRAFELGAWFAFNEVLGLLNTLNDQHPDKGMIYKQIVELRPSCAEAATGQFPLYNSLGE